MHLNHFKRILLDASRRGLSEVVSRTGLSEVVSRRGLSEVVSRRGLSEVVSRRGLLAVVSRRGLSEVVSRSGLSEVVSTVVSRRGFSMDYCVKQRGTETLTANLVEMFPKRLFSTHLNLRKQNSDEGNSAALGDEDMRGKKEEIIKITKKIMESVTVGDYETYQKYVDPDLTCFEPEGYAHLIEGMGFHKFYFDNVLSTNTRPINQSMLQPYVHLLGEDVACIAYIRLKQFMDKNGRPNTLQALETRVFHRRNGKWQNVHFHRSGPLSHPQA